MVNDMATCPYCETQVDKPIKTWTLAPKGKKPVVIGIFRCPNCGKYFRAKAA